VCGRLTGLAAAEVDGEDVVDEAGEVGQLAQVALQGTAGQSRLVERSHEAKHEGIQARRPAGSITTTMKIYFIKHAHRREMCASTWRHFKIGNFRAILSPHSLLSHKHPK
jgi:hypothetical protein